jgi:hypothetical protein
MTMAMLPSGLRLNCKIYRFLTSGHPHHIRQNLPTQYTAQETEAKWQRDWESQQTYRADSNASGDPFWVVIPPPSFTSSLHTGYAFEAASGYKSIFKVFGVR